MQRTTQQNRAFHKYIALLAKALADSGHDMRTLITVEITPTPENVKATIVHEIMTKLYPDITSTAELNTEQINTLYEVINRATAEKLDINIDFPAREQQ